MKNCECASAVRGFSFISGQLGSTLDLAMDTRETSSRRTQTMREESALNQDDKTYDVG